MDILYIIALIAFFTFSGVWGKKRGETKGSTPKKSFGEVFPDIEEWSKPEAKQKSTVYQPAADPVQQPKQTNRETLAERIMKGYREESHQNVTFQINSRPTQDIYSSKKNITSESSYEIRLQTPEEARRAFIYSEIFNRKY